MSTRATYNHKKGFRVGYVGTGLVLEASTRWRETSSQWVEPKEPTDGTFYSTENEARAAFRESGCGGDRHLELIPTKL